MPIFVLISSKHVILSSWHVCLSYMYTCACMFACVGAYVCVHVHLEGHFGSGIFLRCPLPLKLRQEHSLNSDLDDPSQCHWDALPLPLGGWRYRHLLHLPSFHTGSRDPNSSPQACVTNALSTRPSPQPGIVCTCCTSVSCSVKWEE